MKIVNDNQKEKPKPTVLETQATFVNGQFKHLASLADTCRGIIALERESRVAIFYASTEDVPDTETPATIATDILAAIRDEVVRVYANAAKPEPLSPMHRPDYLCVDDISADEPEPTGEKSDLHELLESISHIKTDEAR